MLSHFWNRFLVDSRRRIIIQQIRAQDSTPSRFPGVLRIVCSDRGEVRPFTGCRRGRPCQQPRNVWQVGRHLRQLMSPTTTFRANYSSELRPQPKAEENGYLYKWPCSQSVLGTVWDEKCSHRPMGSAHYAGFSVPVTVPQAFWQKSRRVRPLNYDSGPLREDDQEKALSTRTLWFRSGKSGSYGEYSITGE